jgi:AcrR family transcriptional regulator
MSKGEDTRRRIIAQAAPVFNTHGYSGTSMSELLRATGLEKGGIYNHFASKEVLALAAFDYAVGLVAERFRSATEGRERAVDKIMAIAAVFVDYVINPPLPGGCPVVNTAVEADDTEPALRARAQAAMTSWQKLIGSFVKEGVRSGELRPAADPRAVASLVTSLLEGALVLTRLLDDPAHLNRAYAHIELYLAGLAAPAASSAEHER